MEKTAIMTYRIAINGYGRIGRCILRAVFESSQKERFDIVAINELSDIETIAHLTKYDTTHGRFPGDVRVDGDGVMVVDGKKIRVITEHQVNCLPWRELGVDVVLECTGAFTSREMADKHIACGARKVVFSQPADENVDATIVYGVNNHTLKPSHQVISNASCTSNCIVPILKVIDDAFGIDYGDITTIHSMMNDQPVIDAYHSNDLRRTRAAGHSIIPVDTEIADGVGRIIPHLKGRLHAIALRVPTMNVSAMDTTLMIQNDADVEKVNLVLEAVAAGPLEGIVGFTTEPLSSSDFNHDSRSAIIDGNQTRVTGKRMVKLFAWFDNEWAYANRMLDTTHALMAVSASGGQS